MLQRRTLLQGAALAPFVIPYTALASSRSLFPQNKTYAITFSIDDGFWKSVQQFMFLFGRFHFKATFNLVTSWITPMRSEIGDEYNQSTPHGTWSKWKTVIRNGHEIGSHSMTHPHLPELSPDAIKKELLYSKRRIIKRLHYPGAKTFAFPYNHSSPEVKKLVAKYYLAAREGTQTGEVNVPGAIDFMGIRSWWPLTHHTLDDIIEKIQLARQKKGWLVIGLHGMDGEGWHPIPTPKMTGVLEYVANQEDVYVDTFKKVATWLMKYEEKER